MKRFSSSSRGHWALALLLAGKSASAERLSNVDAGAHFDTSVNNAYDPSDIRSDGAGNEGKVLLAHLPPNTYALRVGRSQLDGLGETAKQEVDASPAGRFEAGWELKFRREVKLRRAATAERRGPD